MRTLRAPCARRWTNRSCSAAERFDPVGVRGAIPRPVSPLSVSGLIRPVPSRHHTLGDQRLDVGCRPACQLKQFRGVFARLGRIQKGLRNSIEPTQGTGPLELPPCGVLARRPERRLFGRTPEKLGHRRIGANTSHSLRRKPAFPGERRRLEKSLLQSLCIPKIDPATSGGCKNFSGSRQIRRRTERKKHPAFCRAPIQSVDR